RPGLLSGVSASVSRICVPANVLHSGEIYLLLTDRTTVISMQPAVICAASYQPIPVSRSFTPA
ncbi:MAG: hypothetical protein J0H90_11495, partial [Rhizobium tropici]|nr:hypothetical protein [Rhizobium tropici]